MKNYHFDFQFQQPDQEPWSDENLLLIYHHLLFNQIFLTQAKNLLSQDLACFIFLRCTDFSQSS